MPQRTNTLPESEKSSELNFEYTKIIIAIVIVAFSALLAIVITKENITKDIIMIGLLFSCLGNIFQLLLSQVQSKVNFNNLTKDLNKKYRAIGGEIQQIKSQTKSISSSNSSLLKRLTTPEESHVLDVLVNTNPIIKNTAEATFYTRVDEFQPDTHGFTIRGTEWGLQSYSYFWTNLIEEQRERKNNNGQNMIITITHSNSIEIWNKQIAEELMTLQGDFCKLDGKIVRVFLSKEKEPNEKYQRIIEQMNLLGIRTFYLEYPYNDFNFDFLWIKESSLVVKWYSDAGGEGIGSCEIKQAIEIDNTKLMNRWRIIGERLLTQQPKSEYMDDSVKSILKLEY